jgi:hypothetical protein
MKKFLAAIAASALVLTLSACSKDVTVDRGEIQSTLGVDEATADCIGDKLEAGGISGDEVEKLNEGSADAELEAKATALIASALVECDVPGAEALGDEG